MTMLNDELYAMYIPHHVLLGWNIMQTVHSICTKLSARYTTYQATDPSDAATDSLQCVKELHNMLRHLQICIWQNPKENIKAASLNLMALLLTRCSNVTEGYLAMIERTHRNVQAE